MRLTGLVSRLVTLGDPEPPQKVATLITMHLNRLMQMYAL